MEPVMTPGAGEWNTSGWLSYAYRPVVVRDANGDVVSAVIRHQTSFDFLAGLGVGRRAAVGLVIPTVLRQTGETTPATVRVIGDSGRAARALGDISLTGKVTLIGQSEMGGFGLAALGRVSLPSGDPSSYASDGALTSELRLAAEMRVIALAIQATCGYRTRAEQRTFAGKTWGDEIPWGLALVIRPQALGWDSQGRWTWVAETHGWLPAGPTAPFHDGSLSPALIGASARYGIGDVSLLVGLEGPLDRAVGVPLLHAVGAVQWAPRLHDMDGDGIEDSVDECPELPEDRDGFQDEDGCPDFDNDDDGVPDSQDLCPDAKEDEDEFQDEDGCPDPDNDSDGIPDVRDACPNEPGPVTKDPKTNGCPRRDRDGDGITDELDQCPDAAEDLDGFQDDDGCPDPDNDGDGIPDGEDRCPNQAGPASLNPARNGCPIADADGDTFDDDKDSCPSEPEVWNGVDDEDGCPDRGGRLLVTVEKGPTGPALRLGAPIRFKGPPEAPEIDDKSVPLLRAVATELNRRPHWILAVGVRDSPDQGMWASSHALFRAFAVVSKLRSFLVRDGVVETVAWSAVKDQPGARENGVGLLVLGETAGSEPVKKPAAGGLAPTGKPAEH